MHWLAATLRNLIALDPQRNSKNSSLVLCGLPDYLELVFVVLALAVEQLECIEPFNSFWPGMKFNYYDVISHCENFKRVIFSRDEWSFKV
jgi:hypothetical protein